MTVTIYHKPACGTSRLCRPSEQVFGLLDNPVSTSVKEDGEIVGAGHS